MKIQLAKSEIIHFIGIGGIGMSGLALIMKGMGFKIQGSDISLNKNIERLKKNNEIFDLIMHIISDHQDVESKINQMQKISYQNTWNNINKKLLSIINEN